jgi:hypothetical protein
VRPTEGFEGENSVLMKMDEQYDLHIGQHNITGFSGCQTSGVIYSNAEWELSTTNAMAPKTPARFPNFAGTIKSSMLFKIDED